MRVLAKLASRSFVCIALAFNGLASAQAKSDAKPLTGNGGFRAAFVDMQSAILQTEEGKIAKGKIEKEAEAKRQEILNQEKDLKKIDDEFQAQSAVLSEDAKRNKQTEFQTKLQKLQTARAGFEQEVRQKEMQETQKIFQNLTSIIDEIAKKKGYDMVFERGAGAVLYAAKIDDLTSEIVSTYNSKHKVSAKK
jgi:outer membrane protein